MMVESGIVDSHVHVLPDPLASKIRAFFTQHLPGPLVYDVDPRSILEQLADAGVVTAWSLPYAHRPGIADPLNEAMRRLIDSLAGEPVRLVGGLTVHPGDDDPQGTVVRGVDELGLRVLKLHCSVGEYSIADPRLAGVWEFAADRGLPVVVHAGTSVSGKTRGSELDELSVVAAANPQVPFIIAHCAHPATDAALAVMRRCPNVYADLTPVVEELVELRRADVEELCERILLGSDAPSTMIDAAAVIGSVRVRYGERAAAAILGGNARRLMAAPE